MREGAEGAKPPPNVRSGGRHYVGKGAFIAVPRYARRPYFRMLLDCLENTQVSGPVWDEAVELEDAFKRFEEYLKAAHASGGKAIFIGNGGSASIASHMAVDYSKNKGVRAVAFNDASMLTMIGNDLGYDRVFAKQLEWYATKKDVAIIVSSSGKSPNILAAAETARERKLRYVVTLSGMNPNNRLRAMGDLNFWVPCTDYGLVELSHLALLHSVAST